MRDPTRQAEQLMTIRLRYTINTHLQDQGITTPAAIGLSAAGCLIEPCRTPFRSLGRANEAIGECEPRPLQGSVWRQPVQAKALIEVFRCQWLTAFHGRV